MLNVDDNILLYSIFSFYARDKSMHLQFVLIGLGTATWGIVHCLNDVCHCLRWQAEQRPNISITDDLNRGYAIEAVADGTETIGCHFTHAAGEVGGCSGGVGYVIEHVLQSLPQ